MIGLHCMQAKVGRQHKPCSEAPAQSTHLQVKHLSRLDDVNARAAATAGALAAAIPRRSLLGRLCCGRFWGARRCQQLRQCRPLLCCLSSLFRAPSTCQRSGLSGKASIHDGGCLAVPGAYARIDNAAGICWGLCKGPHTSAHLLFWLCTAVLQLNNSCTLLNIDRGGGSILLLHFRTILWLDTRT